MKLLILGHARHGKDTIAEFLRDDHGFSFSSSSYFAMDKVVRPRLAALGHEYATRELCYGDRIYKREIWRDAISDYTFRDKARLAKNILVMHDVYVGMRSQEEFDASRHLFDHVIWVKRALREEDDTTMSIKQTPDMIPMCNKGSLADLRSDVQDLANYLNAMAES